VITLIEHFPTGKRSDNQTKKKEEARLKGEKIS